MIIYGLQWIFQFRQCLWQGLSGLVITGVIVVNVVFAYGIEVHKHAKTMKFDLRIHEIVLEALGALGLPVLILGGIYGGIFITESAAVGVFARSGFALKELKVKITERSWSPWKHRQWSISSRRRPVLLGCIEIPDRNRDFNAFISFVGVVGTLSLRTSLIVV